MAVLPRGDQLKVLRAQAPYSRLLVAHIPWIDRAAEDELTREQLTIEGDFAPWQTDLPRAYSRGPRVGRSIRNAAFSNDARVYTSQRGDPLDSTFVSGLMCCWLHFDSLPNTATEIMGWGRIFNENHSWHMGTNATNFLRVRSRSSTNNTLTHSGGITIDEWQHVSVFFVRGAFQSIGINNVWESENNSATVSNSNPVNYYLGNNQASSFGVGQVRIVDAQWYQFPFDARVSNVYQRVAFESWRELYRLMGPERRRLYFPTSVPAPIVDTQPINLPTDIKPTSVYIDSFPVDDINLPTRITDATITIDVPTEVTPDPINLPTDITDATVTIEPPTEVSADPIGLPTEITATTVNVELEPTIGVQNIRIGTSISSVFLGLTVEPVDIALPTDITDATVVVELEPTIAAQNVSVGTHLTLAGVFVEGIATEGIFFDIVATDRTFAIAPTDRDIVIAPDKSSERRLIQ